VVAGWKVVVRMTDSELTAASDAAPDGAAPKAGRIKRTAAVPMKIWSRLNAIDFMNSSFVFAALSILCLFPFMITLSAALGGDFSKAVVHRAGFSGQAAT
jgi:membrane protein